MKPLLFAALALFFQSTLFAQTSPIRGKVIDDSTGVGIPDVTVMLSGGGGTSTGADGSFTLAFPADERKHILTISSAGYNSQTVNASNMAPLVIHLRHQAKDLEDVVVREGSPNASVLIRVRGGGSITQDNSPLYVVDGIQVDNALSTLSVQDIESIDVLKDAASTAIYGARGANGLVIITTKGGHNTGGRTTIAYNGFVGVGKLPKELPVMSPYDYMYYQYERAKLTGDSSGIVPFGYSWDTVNIYAHRPAMGWQHRLLGRSAFQQTHNATVRL